MMEDYSVAVKVSLINHVSAGLVAMAAQFSTLNKQADLFAAKLRALKATALIGAGLIGGGAVIAAPFVYAISKAAELQKHMIAVQTATGATTQELNNMRAAIEHISAQTIFSNVQVAEMAKTIATGTGLSEKKVQDILPVYARFADVQYLMKGSPYDESVKDAIRLAHTAQHYDAESLAKYLDLLTKVSLVVPGNLSEVGHALKYSQGLSKTALGMDDTNSVMLVALLNRLGFAGSRGGTNLIAAMSRSIPGIFGSGLLKGKSAEALKDMGMVDEKGQSKALVDGKFDAMTWMKLLADFVHKEFQTKAPDAARQNIMKDFQHGFGTQGGRVVSLLSSPQALEQLSQLSEKFAKMPGVVSMQEKFKSQSVEQQFFNAKTNLTSLFTELGYTLLPAASKGLVAFNNSITKLIDLVRGHQDAVRRFSIGMLSVAGLSLVGGIITMVVSGLKGLLIVLRLFTIVPAIAGGLTAVAAGFSAVAAGIAPLLAALGVAYGAYKAAGALGAGKVGKYIGNKVYDLTHPSQSSSPIPVKTTNPQPKTIQVSSTINMDGRAIARAVTTHQVSEARSPNATSRFDSSMMGTPTYLNHPNY